MVVSDGLELSCVDCGPVVPVETSEPVNQGVQTQRFQATVIHQTSVVTGITSAEKVIKLVRSIPSICSGDPRKSRRSAPKRNGACHLWKWFFFLGGGGWERGMFKAMFILHRIALLPHEKLSDK